MIFTKLMILTAVITVAVDSACIAKEKRSCPEVIKCVIPVKKCQHKKTTEKITCRPTNLTNNEFNNTNKGMEYAIMVDAGSSGNRFYAYKLNPLNKFSNFIEEEIYKCSTSGPSLDQIKTKEELEANFNDCINNLKSTIPSEKHSVTSINLFATAGMRFLALKNNTHAKEILTFVDKYFGSTGFKNNPTYNLILDGAYEGILAWTVANILLNNTNNGGENRVGLLDLGGASSQISYSPHVTVNHTLDFYMNMTNDENIPQYATLFDLCPVFKFVYSNSMLCYGQNQMRYMYEASQIAKHVLNSEKNKNVSAACYPENLMVKYDSEFFDSICLDWVLSPANMTNTKVRQNNLTITGSRSNSSSHCRKEIKSLIYQRSCNGENCEFMGAFQPPTDYKLKAINGFYYTVSNLKSILNITENLSMKSITNYTDYVCSLDIEELRNVNEKNGGGLPDIFLIRTCFLLSYVLEVLDSYGLSLNQIDFERKLNGFSVNWSYGAVVLMENYLKYNEKLEFPGLAYDTAKENSKALDRF